MSFGVGIGDVITIINIGLDVYNKINAREEPIVEIANRLKSLERYLVPLKEFVDSKSGLAGLYGRGYLVKLWTMANQVQAAGSECHAGSNHGRDPS
jgi:hypothetical protein